MTRPLAASAWVETETGVRLVPAPDVPDAAALDDGAALTDLVGLALRRNPRRAHLLVSTVLAKHVPVAPGVVLDAGRALGEAVRTVLAGTALADGTGAPCAPLVVGYAETATALGHAVADAIGAPCLHSTRRRVPGVAALAFEEEHSHATSHLLLPENPDLLGGGRTLVLVDDELSTGRTVLNTLRVLAGSAAVPGRRCVVAALVDVRSPADRALARETARSLGVELDVVSLASGAVVVPDDTLFRAAALLAEHGGSAAPTALVPEGDRAPVVDLGSAGWPVGVREGGRHGLVPQDAAVFDRAVEVVAARVVDSLGVPGPHLPRPLAPGARVLVLGTEELMWAPQRIAAAIAVLVPPGVDVLVSSTTRSPVLVVDDPGYPLRTALTFAGDDGGPRFAYGVAPGHEEQGFDEVVLVLDDGAGPGGVVDAVASACGRLTVVTLPAHLPGGPGAQDGSQR